MAIGKFRESFNENILGEFFVEIFAYNLQKIEKKNSGFRWSEQQLERKDILYCCSR